MNLTGYPEDTAAVLDAYDGTMVTLPADGPMPGERTPPAELLSRYQEVRFIGEGSTGTVFKAKDPRLGRPVAIKLLRSDDPVDARRFMKEAQTQARVQHENVCRVYEVGEAGGAHYIAMELIEGEPLDRVQHRMTLEQKVTIMCQVSAAVHEAHRLGLIHRDIKPSNIMVTTTDDGSYKPYVVDFGLAREISTVNNSTQNGIAGTPAYMSPEQAEGNTALLDRRSDVYSLGSTLFDLVAGRTPFVGANALTLLTQVMYEDAPALSVVRKGVPKQLETIVMTCLQREPGRRYQSARALAEDLQRYLDGAQVQAKRPPWTYVLRQRAKRHKAVVAIAILSFLVVSVLGVMWIQSATNAGKQAELARELGEDVKYVELFLRSAYGMPGHDIAREQLVVRRRLVKIEQRMAEVGRLGQGPGHYALGRGHLALHEYEAAQKNLESSLANGYEKPEVHYALGLALGERYQKALDDARRIADTKARKAAIQDAETTYQQPALRHLLASGGTEVESRTYVEGLVALYERRYEDAAAKAIAAMDEAPWFYEAKKLEGDARLASGLREVENGRKREGHQMLTRAVDAYRAAAEIATSDSSIHEALAAAWLQVLYLQLWEGAPYQEAFEASLRACDDAIKANPLAAGPLNKKSQAYCYVGHHELRSGADPRDKLRKAIEAGLSAQTIAPDDAISADSVGNAHTYIAKYDRKLGLNPIPQLNEGIAQLDQATRIQPTFAWAWNDGGVAYRIRAEYEAEHGLDPRPALENGLARFRRATDEDPHYVYAYANTTYLLGISASYEFVTGHDPRAIVKNAVEIAEVGAKEDPSWYPLLNNRGWAELVAAQYEENTGADPSKTLDNVEASFQASLGLNKDEADTQFGMGAARHVRALHQIRQNLDPQKYFDEARTFLTRAAELDAQEPAIRLELGQLNLSMARHALDEKHEAESFINDAEKVFRDGLRLNARHAALHAALAEALAMLAEHGARKDAEKEKIIADGLTEADEALKHNPKWALAFAVKGSLYALRAGMAKNAERDENERLALESFDKALAINALLPSRFKEKIAALRGAANGSVAQTAKTL